MPGGTQGREGDAGFRQGCVLGGVARKGLPRKVTFYTSRADRDRRDAHGCDGWVGLPVEEQQGSDGSLWLVSQ